MERDDSQRVIRRRSHTQIFFPSGRDSCDAVDVELISFMINDLRSVLPIWPKKADLTEEEARVERVIPREFARHVINENHTYFDEK